MKICRLSQENGFQAGQIMIADSFWTRFRGLMFRKTLAPWRGLLLKNCSAIHCCFMRIPIDVVYLDREQTVLAVETVNPWRIGKIVPGAQHTLELELGGSRGLEIGKQLEIKEYNNDEQ